MRILLVDDHLLFREALSLMLQQLDSDVSCVFAGSGAEALAAANYYRDLDLIVVDLALPDTDGIELLDALGKIAIDTPRVVISACDDAARVSAAMRAGASGYVPKKSSGSEMLGAMQAVLSGGTYVPSTLLAEMGETALPSTSRPPSPDAAKRRDPAETPRLSARQQQVLVLLKDGAPNKVIARELHLSEGTVKLHVSAVLQLLGARNRTEAVSVAIQQGLFSDTQPQ
jgi:DNA-binding NarL/FixJ family response regulator